MKSNEVMRRFNVYMLFQIILLSYCFEQENKYERNLYKYKTTEYNNYIPNKKFLPNQTRQNFEAITFRYNDKILFEGSFCRRTVDGQEGYCILAHKCLHVVEEFRKNGIKIDLCTYVKTIPVICCPLGGKDASLKLILKKRISDIKCDEYNGNNSFRENESTYRKISNITRCEPSIPFIVGGEITHPAEFPHMAAVGWRKASTGTNWACGGTLISEKFVLTAGHCTHLGGKKPDIVRLGAQNLYSNSNTSALEIEISDIFINPKYKMSSYYHDIALLKLIHNVTITKFIRPACLWQKPNFSFEYGIATGWGRKHFLGPKSDKLLKVSLKIFDQNLCKKLYSNERRLPEGILTNYQFCAGYLEGGKDTCQGDSGGPLQINIESKCTYYVLGITSFGKFCAASNAPGVYTKVYAYIDWIEKIVF